MLSAKASFEFKTLFEILQTHFKEHKSTHGAEELMRLRTYEKLQALVNRGMVEKKISATTKTYRGLAGLSSVMPVAASASI